MGGLGFTQKKPRDEAIGNPVSGVSPVSQLPESQALLQKGQQRSREASREPAIIQRFKDRPIHTMALVLADIGAGLEGVELPTDRMARQQKEQELFEQQQTTSSISAANSLFRTAVSIHEQGGDAGAYLRSFGESIPSSMGTLKEIVTQGAESFNMEDAQEVIDLTSNPYVKRIHRQTGSYELAFKIQSDPDTMDQLWQLAKREWGGIVTQKISQWGSHLQGNSATEGADTDVQGNIRLNARDLIAKNGAIREQNPNFALSEEELDTALYFPGLFKNTGFTLTGVIDPEQQDLGLSAPEVKQALQLLAAGVVSEFPEGTISTGTRALLTKEGGGLFSPEEATKVLETGTTQVDPVTGRVLSRAQQSSDVRKADQRKSLAATAINMSNLIDDMITLVDADPGINTTVRGGFRAAASLASNADEALRLFGNKLDDSIPEGLRGGGITAEALEANSGLRKQLEDKFPGLAGAASTFQAQAFNLAIFSAAVKGQENRALSDTDLRLTIQSLGTDRDDPIALKAALRENQRISLEALATRLEVEFDAPPEEIARIRSLIKTTAPGGKLTRAQVAEGLATIRKEADLPVGEKTLTLQQMLKIQAAAKAFENGQ